MMVDDIDRKLNLLEKIDEPTLRTFESGATRDDDSSKLDFEGFLSPLALAEFARYMDSHRTQSDGSVRPSDNWQKGIPLDAYMKSMWRHFMDVWSEHRKTPLTKDTELQIEALCAVLFNVQGYLHELLKQDWPGDPDA